MELYSLQHPDKIFRHEFNYIHSILVGVQCVKINFRGSMTPLLFYFKIRFRWFTLSRSLCITVTFFYVSNHRSRETSASLPSEVWTFRPPWVPFGFWELTSSPATTQSLTAAIIASDLPQQSDTELFFLSLRLLLSFAATSSASFWLFLARSMLWNLNAFHLYSIFILQ